MRSVMASVLVGAGLLFGGAHAHAGLSGDTVNFTYYYPDLGTVDQSYADQAVSPTASFNYNGWFTIAVSDSRVAVDFERTITFFSESFNGFLLTDLTKPLGAVSLDPATNMAGFGASNFSVSGNVLSVNWQGLSFDPSTNVTFDVPASPADVPEPTSIALLGSALLAVWMLRLRMRRAHARIG